LKKTFKIIKRTNNETGLNNTSKNDENPEKNNIDTLRTFMQGKQIRESVLYIDHGVGGGCNQYLDLHIAENTISVTYLVRYNINSGRYDINVYYDSESISFSLTTIDDVFAIINSQGIKKITLNNIISFPDTLNILKRLIDAKKRRNIEVTMHIHDYFSVCPTFYLLDKNQNYCGPLEFKECEKCYPSSGEMIPPVLRVETGIQEWRKLWKEFLFECDTIVVFSESSKSILEAVYGNLPQIKIIPHTVDYIEKVDRTSKSTNTINIGILGDVVYHKGSLILGEMVNIAADEERYSNVRFVLFGTVHPSIESNVFIETGNYSKENLPALTIENDIDIFIVPSICPETFSYTTQEIIEMNMPVACFDLGAPAERVKNYDKGLIVSETTGKCALETIVNWYDLNEI